MKITLGIGKSTNCYLGCIAMDSVREITFEGEKLGECRNVRYDPYYGSTLGISQALYRVNGKLLVHTEEWSSYRDRQEYYGGINVVSESDLLPGGDFEALGRACGL